MRIIRRMGSILVGDKEAQLKKSLAALGLEVGAPKSGAPVFVVGIEEVAKGDLAGVVGALSQVEDLVAPGKGLLGVVLGALAEGLSPAPLGPGFGVHLAKLEVVR